VHLISPTVFKTFGDKRLFACEVVRDTRIKLERSIAAVRKIKAGETIKEDDLHLLSPGDGFNWIEKDNVIGKITLQDIPKDEIIYHNMIR